MGTAPITVLIVDDEPQARKGLRKLLERNERFHCLGEARNGLEAIEMIPRYVPQVLLLDIQMPEINGFEVLQSLPVAVRPLTIFITAYDAYALRAFEVHAIDYILKPFTDARFVDALDRAASQLITRELNTQHQRMNQLLSHWMQAQGQQGDILVSARDPLEQRLIIKHEGSILFLDYAEIRWVEAYDYYVKIHVAQRFYLIRNTLKGMAERLPSRIFARVHKSALVNLQYVKRLEPGTNGTYILHLAEGQQIKMSRTYSQHILNLLVGD